MLDLDFGILFTVGVEIENLPFSKEGFRIIASPSTVSLLKKHQSVYRYRDHKGHLLVSDLVGTFEELQVGNRKKISLKLIAENYFNTFFIFLSNKSLAYQLDGDYDWESLPTLQGLPTSFKRLFYIDLSTLPGANPIDKDNILGLAPPVLKFPVDQVESLVHQATGTPLLPSEEDDVYAQYNFNNARVGLYQLKLRLPIMMTRQIYIDPTLYQKPPFGIAEIAIAAGNVATKEYQIVFKKKT